MMRKKRSWRLNLLQDLCTSSSEFLPKFTQISCTRQRLGNISPRRSDQNSRQNRLFHNILAFVMPAGKMFFSGFRIGKNGSGETRMNTIGSHPNDENQECWTRGWSPAAQAPYGAAAGIAMGVWGQFAPIIFFLFFMGNPFRNAQWTLRRWPPLSLERGRQHAGASPLDPPFLQKNSHESPSTVCSTGRGSTRPRAPVALSQSNPEG